MIFNSVTYLLFLSIVASLFWLLPTRPRLWMLFAASVVFYGFWRFDFALVMLFSAIVDFNVSLRLARTDDERKRFALLLTSLVINLGLLGYFKYLQFVIDSLWSSFSLFGISVVSPELDILLPLGISFYTFQTISYTIDVYRRQIKPIRDFALYGCYVTFFPQLVAGPILRATEVCSQLSKEPRFDWQNLALGVKRILMGLFLKVCLADNIAPFVNEGFSADPTSFSALDVWTLTFLFGFQIYFDFSAYSHIALGSAQLMGIQFPENFNFPYLATSPRDFWSRWHISLSSWIRDYLYLPMCGVKFRSSSEGGIGQEMDKPTEQRRTQALLWTWAIMGLWHGAGFVFLFWGFYHAIAIVGYRATKSIREKIPVGPRTLLGFFLTLPLMMAGWIFFRAESVNQALTMYLAILDPTRYTGLGLRENNYLVAALITLSSVLAGVYSKFLSEPVERNPFIALPVYSLCYGVLLFLVFVYLRPLEQFIYFQF